MSDPPWGLPLAPPFAPMEADLVEALPAGDAWRFEPKWDGFRCLAFREGRRVELWSKAQKRLERYFPEVVGALLALDADRFVLDGELVVPVEQVVSFDHLLQRIHPAASRVQRLANATPASLIVFDLLVDERGEALLDRPLAVRRAALRAFAERHLTGVPRLELSPQTADPGVAARWLSDLDGVDGVIAKRVDLPYAAGERLMLKVKRLRTCDCVVGGFRYAKGGGGVGSLLLGLYDEDGLLHHVGYTASLSARARRDLLPELEALRSPPGFTGRAPGGPSRWSTRRSDAWEPLRPERVVEVRYDHFSGERFRHGTRLHRWRPDKAPRQCTFAQVRRGGRAGALTLLRAG